MADHRPRQLPRRCINDLLRAQVTPATGCPPTSAKHWHRQLSQLTAPGEGMRRWRAPASLSNRTPFKWLSDPDYNVRRSYRDLIHTRTRTSPSFRGPHPRQVKDGQFEISGLVKTGADDANAAPAAQPLCASTRAAATGATSNTVAGRRPAGRRFEDRFIDDVIVADIGEAPTLGILRQQLLRRLGERTTHDVRQAALTESPRRPPHGGTQQAALPLVIVHVRRPRTPGAGWPRSSKLRAPLG